MKNVTLLKVSEAAKRCNSSHEFFYRKIRAGEIAAININAGGQKPSYRIPESELDRILGV